MLFSTLFTFLFLYIRLSDFSSALHYKQSLVLDYLESSVLYYINDVWYKYDFIWKQLTNISDSSRDLTIIMFFFTMSLILILTVHQ